MKVREITAQVADSTTADLDVGVGAGIFGTIPRAQVCVDIDIPRQPLPMFVRASAEFLPFRDKAFRTVKAYNVLEHVHHPWGAVAETLRVGSRLIARQDSWMCFAIWATPEHEWLQFPGFKFYKFPRTKLGIQTSKFLRSIATTASFGRLISKAHLMFRWDYYSIDPD